MKQRICMLVLILIHISLLFWGPFVNIEWINYLWYGVLFAGSIYYLFKNSKKLSILKGDFKNNILFIGVSSLIAGILYFVANGILASVFSAGVILTEENVSSSNLLMVSLTLLMWAPVVEEIIMRYLYKETIINKYAYVAFSTLFFGLMHSISVIYPITYILLAALPYFVIGMYLSILYLKTDNIFISIIMHVLINIVGLVMILNMV